MTIPEHRPTRVVEGVSPREQGTGTDEDKNEKRRRRQRRRGTRPEAAQGSLLPLSVPSRCHSSHEVEERETGEEVEDNNTKTGASREKGCVNVLFPASATQSSRAANGGEKGRKGNR